MTLRTRITMLVAGAVAIAVAVAAAAAFVSARQELRNEVDEFLTERAAPVAALPDRDFQSGVSGLPRRGAGRNLGPLIGSGATLQLIGTDSIVQIIDPGGQLVYVFDENMRLPIGDEERRIVAAKEGRVLRDIEVDGEKFRMITVATPVGGAVQIARSLTETEAVLRDLGIKLVVIGLLGVAVAAAAGWFVARRSLAPVGALTEAAENIAITQDLSHPIDVEQQDEIGRLASSFNAMLAALRDSRLQQHRLVQDAGHELRTPLTALRTNIEVLARNTAMDPDDRERLLADLTAEIGELSGLVSELVDLATDQHTEEPVGPVRLDEVTERAADRIRRRNGREIRIEATPTVVNGRAAMLERAIGNLLDNADKWSPAGEPIDVTIEAGRVTVSDRGPGIAPEDRPHIFERFYRAPEARTRPGSGLGLAIVEHIVATHDGSVFVAQSDGGGAAVGFVIPVTDVEED